MQIQTQDENRQDNSFLSHNINSVAERQKPSFNKNTQNIRIKHFLVAIKLKVSGVTRLGLVSFVQVEIFMN